MNQSKDLHEAAFEAWCEKHTATLQTLWTVSNEKQNGMEYKVFCRQVYTGRIKTKLIN